MYYITLRNQIERTAGRKMQTPKDFDFLSQSIFERTKSLISVSTLKRFFGYLSQEGRQSRSTLDVLCQYVGYVDWDTFLQQTAGDGEAEIESNPLLCNRLYADDLRKGELVRVVWKPNRECCFKYLGDDRFIVVKSVNSKLAADATFKCHMFVEDEPLYLTELMMPNATKALDYVCGRANGVKFYV